MRKKNSFKNSRESGGEHVFSGKGSKNQKNCDQSPPGPPGSMYFPKTFLNRTRAEAALVREPDPSLWGKSRLLKKTIGIISVSWKDIKVRIEKGIDETGVTDRMRLKGGRESANAVHWV